MTSELFRPTYLYIKQHSITGKLYFGKTVKNPEKYYGSGRRWRAHINKYGKEYVTTLWYCLYLDEKSINDFSVMFSKNNNIVESNDWLNLIQETGLGDIIKRGPWISEKRKKYEIMPTRCIECGHIISFDKRKHIFCSTACANKSIGRQTRLKGGHMTQKLAVSVAHKGKKRKARTIDHVDKIIDSKNKNGTNKHSTETKQKMSLARKGIKHSDSWSKNIAKANYKPIHVHNIATGMSYNFESIKDALNSIPELNSTGITKLLQGTSLSKKSKMYNFEINYSSSCQS